MSVVKHRIDPRRFGAILRAMLGPTLPDAKTAEEAAWEDDGGALTVRCEGYEHIIGPLTGP